MCAPDSAGQVTTARSELHWWAERNQRLKEMLPEALAALFCAYRGRAERAARFFDFVPRPDELLDFFAQFEPVLWERLRQERCVRTVCGEWRRPAEVLFPSARAAFARAVPATALRSQGLWLAEEGVSAASRLRGAPGGVETTLRVLLGVLRAKATRAGDVLACADAVLDEAPDGDHARHLQTFRSAVLPTRAVLGASEEAWSLDSGPSGTCWLPPEGPVAAACAPLVGLPVRTVHPDAVAPPGAVRLLRRLGLEPLTPRALVGAIVRFFEGLPDGDGPAREEDVRLAAACLQHFAAEPLEPSEQARAAAALRVPCVVDGRVALVSPQRRACLLPAFGKCLALRVPLG